MESLIDAYIETLLWSSTDCEGESLDKYYISDISQTDRDIIKADIIKFEQLVDNSILESFENITELTDNDYNHIMHDFVLTRNRHGAGFWDGDYNVTIGNINIGDELTKISGLFNEVFIEIGDDDKLYLI